MNANKHKLSKEQSIKLIQDLQNHGLLKQEHVNEALCAEVKFPCPLCGHNLIIIQSGGSFEIICKQNGILVAMRGM